MNQTLLDVRDVRTVFKIRDGIVPAVDRVSFTINRNETVAVVGESGCGKSVTALTIMRLIKTPPGSIEQGEVLFEGENLLKLPERRMRQIRGNDISMIFQEPMTSLNPVLSIDMQMTESIMIHSNLSRRQARERAVELLRKVEIPEPGKRIDEYPHQLSGGMRQRVMIAIALACNPKLLIADEPTTALDVTIQAQLMLLLQNLRDELGMGIMLITHDLGVVANMADRVIVMYAGQIVEQASVRDLFFRPRHPYTEGLLRSVPSLDERVEKLHVITGTVPNLLFLAPGCRFNPRCPYAQEKCRSEEPVLESGDDGHSVRCWYPLTGERGES